MVLVGSGNWNAHMKFAQWVRSLRLPYPTNHRKYWRNMAIPYDGGTSTNRYDMEIRPNTPSIDNIFSFATKEAKGHPQAPSGASKRLKELGLEGEALKSLSNYKPTIEEINATYASARKLTDC